MRKISLILLAVLVLLAAAWLMRDRFAFLFFRPGAPPAVPPGTITVVDREALKTSETVPYEIEEVASGLQVPWSIVFTSSDRILVTERPGRLRVIENGALKEKPLHTFPEVSATGEEGLMSIVLHPQYETNRELYFSLVYETGGKMFLKVVRFRDEGDRLSDETVIIDKIPATQYHAGSRIKFGPDGKLYVTTGDATERDLAQDLGSLAGKILRINPDGTRPNDNPLPGSLIWSYGHRNPQGIAWHPATGELYSTEHGPSVFDGPTGGDEVNRIVKAGNYGWPLVSHERTQEGTVAPLLVFTPSEAPASALFYSGDALPQFRNNFFFGALIGQGLWRVVMSDTDPNKTVLYEKLADVHYGRIRDVAQGPDGFIYFSTSNRDGRGDPHPRDDRIFRIKPKQ